MECTCSKQIQNIDVCRLFISVIFLLLEHKLMLNTFRGEISPIL